MNEVKIYTVEGINDSVTRGLFLSFNDANYYLNMLQSDYKNIKNQLCIKEYLVKENWKEDNIMLPDGKVKSGIGFVKTILGKE